MSSSSTIPPTAWPSAATGCWVQHEDCGIYCELFKQGVAQQVIKDLPLPLLFDLAFGPIVSVARNHILGFIQLDATLIQRDSRGLLGFHETLTDLNVHSF